MFVRKHLLMNQNGFLPGTGGTGGSVGANTGNTGTPNPDQNTGGAPEYKYPADLDPSFHGNPTLLKYVDKEKKEFKTGEMMKALIHATSMIGADKLVVPTADFTPEQWKETFKKLGVPEKFEDYKIENNLPDGINPNEDLFTGFKKTAHEAGLLPKQAQAIIDYHNKTLAEQAKKFQDEHTARYNADVEALKKEWGPGYDKMVKLADLGLKQFADEKLMAEIQKTGMLGSTAMTKLFAAIGKTFAEDKVAGSFAGAMSKTKDEMKAEISSWYKDKNHPFMRATHPEHQSYLKKYNEYMTAIHGDAVVVNG